MSKLARRVWLTCSLAALIGAGFPTAVRAQQVDKVQIDVKTGGNGIAKYGQCYAVIPYDPNTTKFPEDAVGPKFAKEFPRRYTVKTLPSGPFVDAQCITGKIADKVDFAVSAITFPGDNPEKDPIRPPKSAFVWHYCEPGTACDEDRWKVLSGVSQVRPDGVCPTQPRIWNGVWDSETPSFEPLEFRLKIGPGGSAKLAYYFLEGAEECRTTAFKLYINGGSPAAQGEISDFRMGKYLVFHLSRLLPNSEITLWLQTQSVPGCGGFANGNQNALLGGAFLSGAICDPEKPEIDIRKQKEGPDSRTVVLDRDRDDDDHHGDGDDDDNDHDGKCDKHGKPSGHGDKDRDGRCDRDGKNYSRDRDDDDGKWSRLESFLDSLYAKYGKEHDDDDDDDDDDDGKDGDHDDKDNDGRCDRDDKPSGHAIKFEIKVTNTGNTTLTNVKVTDEEVPACNKHIGTLDPGKSVTYWCTDKYVKETYTNIACVTGEFGAENANDCDPSTVIVERKRHDCKDDDDHDGRCDHCGKPSGDDDDDHDGKCDKHRKKSGCGDDDHDGRCDKDGKKSDDDDKDHDGKCDKHGKKSGHGDKDKDGKCDKDGEKVKKDKNDD